LPPVPATADLDYKILLTSPPGADYNKTVVRIMDNGNSGDTIPAPTHTVVDAVLPTADLAGEILVTGINEAWLNVIDIVVKDGGDGFVPFVKYDGKVISITIDAGTTTQNDIAAALIAHRLITSAVCDSEGAVWTIVADNDDSNNYTDPAYTSFSGGSYKTILVAIESGKTTQDELADYLKNNLGNVVTAKADNESYNWTVGEEAYSDYATFTGGSDNRNFYINEDLSKESPHMASHTFNTPGEYTVSVKIKRPDGEEPSMPEVETLTINVLPSLIDSEIEKKGTSNGSCFIDAMSCL